MILHLVNKSPFSNNSLHQCLQLLGERDSIVLLEDAVLLLANPQAASGLPPAERLFAIESDIQARGLSACAGITGVEYEQLVELVVRHDKTLSWF